MDNKAPWLINKILQLGPATASLNSLMVSLSAATKVRLSDDILKVVGQFSSLRPEDLAAILPQSEFPNSFIWVEWDNTNRVLPDWPPFTVPERPNLTQMGMLISTAPDRRAGRIDFVSDFEDIFVVPLSLLFNWRKSFQVPEEIMDQLRKNLELISPEQSDIYFSDKIVESLLEIRRRFATEPSPYIEVPENATKKMQQIYDNATEFLIAAEPFIIGIANTLECCHLNDWRAAKMSIH